MHLEADGGTQGDGSTNIKQEEKQRWSAYDGIGDGLDTRMVWIDIDSCGVGHVGGSIARII